MNYQNQIYVAIDQMMEKPVELRKVFKFSVEDLQDNPVKCVEEMESYLKEHSEKIESFWLEEYIDEETFDPHLVMHITPVKKWRELMQKNRLMERLFSDTWKVNILKKRISEILFLSLLELNTPENRKKIAEMIQLEMKKLFNDSSIVEDTTSAEDVDAGGVNFAVKNGDEKIDLSVYIEKMKTK